MPAHIVQNAARSWALVDLVPDLVFAPKTFAAAVDALEDSTAVVPRGVHKRCPYPTASTLIDNQPTFAAAAASASAAAVTVAKRPSPPVSLQMLPFVGNPDTPRSESEPTPVGHPGVFEHGGYGAETPSFGSAMPPHGVAAAGADDHHELHAEGSPPTAHSQRLPQTVPPHLPQPLEVASGSLAHALWDETGPKGSGFVSETAADATYATSSTSTSSAAPAGAMSRPSLCVCKKLAVGAMLIADSASISSAAGATAGGLGGAGGGAGGAGGAGAAERPGRVCANRGKQGGCTYQAFTDVPLVPSATVSSEGLRLVIHKSDSTCPKRDMPSASNYPPPSLGSARARAWVREGDLVVTLKLFNGGAEEVRTYAELLRKWVHGVALSSENSVWEIPRTSTHQLMELHRFLGVKVEVDVAVERLVKEASCAAKGEQVPVTVRRWILDAVASVHCSDARMMDDMSHLVPVALGQSHLSPDGSGLLIALHISAISSFVQSLATLPGVVKVEGAEKIDLLFHRSDAALLGSVSPTVSASPRSSVATRSSRYHHDRRSLPRSSNRSSMVAPVPVRASNMVPPSIWSLAMGAGRNWGNPASNTLGRVRGRERVVAPHIPTATGDHHLFNPVAGAGARAGAGAGAGADAVVAGVPRHRAGSSAAGLPQFSSLPDYRGLPAASARAQGQSWVGGVVDAVCSSGDDGGLLGGASSVASGNFPQGIVPRSASRTSREEPDFKRQRTDSFSMVGQAMDAAQFGAIPVLRTSISDELLSHSSDEEADGDRRTYFPSARLPRVGSLGSTVGELSSVPAQPVLPSVGSFGGIGSVAGGVGGLAGGTGSGIGGVTGAVGDLAGGVGGLAGGVGGGIGGVTGAVGDLAGGVGGCIGGVIGGVDGLAGGAGGVGGVDYGGGVGGGVADIGGVRGVGVGDAGAYSGACPISSGLVTAASSFNAGPGTGGVDYSYGAAATDPSSDAAGPFDSSRPFPYLDQK